MKKSVKYIGFYDCPDSKIQRYYTTSSLTKMDYIIQSIARVGYRVEILSTSAVSERKFKLHKGGKKIINDKIILFLPPSFGGIGKVISKIKVLWHLVYLFFKLLLFTHKNEIVIVYHSLGYFNIILWAKKIKKFKLILEVEEIYQDVSAKSKYLQNIEYKMFDIADAYFFSTELLNKKLNVSNKPSVINYGTYKNEPKIIEKFNDNKIHIIYAGTFDVHKGGATAAVKAAEFLPDNYHIHICGFGTENEINQIKQLIADTAIKTKAIISYEGLLKGFQYIKFLQQCHIGLSTQNPDADFNDTSFPSKILSYMSNGLTVVSVKINAIVNSKVGAFISYYENQTPEEIAESIIEAKIDNNNREIITQLDIDFLSQLNGLFSNF